MNKQMTKAEAEKIADHLNDLSDFVHSGDPRVDGTMAAGYGLTVAAEHRLPSAAFGAIVGFQAVVSDFLDGLGDDVEHVGNAAVLERMVDAVISRRPTVAGPLAGWLFARLREDRAGAEVFRSTLMARLRPHAVH